MNATSRKTKTPQGWQAEGAFNTSSDNANHTPIRTRLKAAIIHLALWGLIPAGLATWLIERGGLRHE